MQKKYSKSELEKQANAYFSENGDLSQVFCTTDGQIFLEENRADLHAKSEEKMAVFAFQNPKGEEVEKTAPKAKAGKASKAKTEKEEVKEIPAPAEEQEVDNAEKGNEDEATK